ncbi:phytanoyl-CoA dioxygenase family protein [Pedobacter montanisoli]|uniref:Phytanoyl-CoA dioxygenase family protein n=1 Tax=Pedobacter montanisoli TaxID=2923277 RepID=A0ABS9ZRC2_9SPHI|nr:phytanoyl-CoA dioxygenase family protein [Pedobacter montanisoli]MCJ0741139.1 phytanoyl-CoA dioxygenase family protein [Pedobacter montanisoli]
MTGSVSRYKQEIEETGFTTIDKIYSEEEIADILKIIDTTDSSKETFRKSDDLFAIRQFLKEIPEITSLIFNQKLNHLISDLFGNEYFVVKSIYFDKPGKSNWYVSYHQDLTISVDHKTDHQDFGPWTKKQNQYAVQPPLHILERNFTIRIHLDDTNELNGALKVIPKSHLKKIYRPENIDWTIENEVICSINKGGVMIMKPLILHSSNRTVNQQRRRVIHIEFSNSDLPKGINWAEKFYQ